MKKTNKKGFTLVELLVVIAILAILATVAIVGYTSFTNKAHESNDRTLVAELNTAVLRGDGKKYANPHEAFEAVRAQGFDVALIKATAKDNAILWDADKGEFFYSADGARPGNIWMVTDDATKVDDKYSIYYVGTANINSATVKNLIVYTNDPTLVLSIDAEKAHVVHEGKAGTVNVNKVAPNSYYENGMVNELNVATTGNVKVYGTVASLTLTAGATVTLEAGSETVKVIVNDADATITPAAEAVVGNIASEDATIAEKLATDIVKGDVADDVIIDTAVKADELGDFAGGFGTKEFPYIIETPEQLMNINKYYGTYNYYKVDAATLDMTGIGKINLTGSFDGNGVKFANLTMALFARVEANGDIATVKNFTIDNCRVVTTSYYDAPVVDYSTNSSELILDNINISGYAEATIISSFVGQAYATTTTIKNCVSTLTLVSTAHQVSGFVGNGTSSNGAVTSVNVIDSIFSGSMVSTSESRYVFAHTIYDTVCTLTRTLSYTDEFKATHANLYPEFTTTIPETANTYSKFSKLSPKALTAPEAGQVITLEKDAGAVKAVATFVVGVNPGNYTGVYAQDEIDLTNVTKTFSTVNVKNYNVVINDGEHSTGIVGDTCFIERDGLDGTYSCIVLTVVQYDGLGAVTSISTITLQ